MLDYLDDLTNQGSKARGLPVIDYHWGRWGLNGTLKPSKYDVFPMKHVYYWLHQAHVYSRRSDSKVGALRSYVRSILITTHRHLERQHSHWKWINSWVGTLQQCPSESQMKRDSPKYMPRYSISQSSVMVWSEKNDSIHVFLRDLELLINWFFPCDKKLTTFELGTISCYEITCMSLRLLIIVPTPSLSVTVNYTSFPCSLLLAGQRDNDPECT